MLARPIGRGGPAATPGNLIAGANVGRCCLFLPISSRGRRIDLRGVRRYGGSEE